MTCRTTCPDGPSPSASLPSSGGRRLAGLEVRETSPRCEALAVSNVIGPVVSVTVEGLGERPVWLRLHLDDGRLVDLAVRNGDVSWALGPFVVASLS